MKREFDMQFTYNQLRTIEKMLEVEVEDYLFEEDCFDLEHAVDLIVMYRQFRDAADAAADDIIENATEEQRSAVAKEIFVSGLTCVDGLEPTMTSTTVSAEAICCDECECTTEPDGKVTALHTDAQINDPALVEFLKVIDSMFR